MAYKEDIFSCYLTEETEAAPATQRIRNELGLGNEHTAREFYRRTGITGPYRNEELIVEIFTRGTYTFLFNDEQYRMEAPFLVVRLPGSVWWPEKVSRDAQLKNYIISSGFLNEIYADTGDKRQFIQRFAARPVLTLTSDQTDYLLSYYNLMITEMAYMGPGRREVVRYLLSAMLCGLARFFAPNPRIRAASNLHREIADRFTSLLQQHFRREHTVKFYADALGVTPNHLVRVITSATGTPPGAQINDALLAAVKTDLRRTSKPLTDFARDYNFKSLSHFTHWFKLRTGLPPHTYRHTHRPK